MNAKTGVCLAWSSNGKEEGAINKTGRVII